MEFTAVKSKLIIYLVLSFLGTCLFGGVITWIVVDTMGGSKLVSDEELAPYLPARPDLNDYSTDGYRNDAFTAAETAYEQTYDQVRAEQQAMKEQSMQEQANSRMIIGAAITIIVGLAYVLFCYRLSVASIVLTDKELKVRFYSKKETIYQLDQVVLNKRLIKVYRLRYLFIPRRFYDIEVRANGENGRVKDIVDLSLFAKATNEEIFANFANI